MFRTASSPPIDSHLAANRLGGLAERLEREAGICRIQNPSEMGSASTGVGRWGENGESATKDGVVVERHGAMIAELECDMLPINELSPEFFESLGMDPASEEEFAFPD